MGRRRRVSTLLGAAVTAAALLAPVGGPAGAQQAPGKPSDVLTPTLRAIADEAPSGSVSRQAAAAHLPATGEGTLSRVGPGELAVNITVSDPAVLSSAALAAAGARVIAVAPGSTYASVAVAGAELAALATVPGVLSATEVLTPIVGGAGVTDAPSPSGPVTQAACGDRRVSQADTHLRAALARSTFGLSGAGVKVGILSDSYDAKGGAATDVADGELPGPGNPCGKTTPVQVLADSTDTGVTDEGRAMAQLVHDVAPNATLLFATAFASDVGFANNIRALRDAGATVIVDDVLYVDEPMYQDGIIAQAVNEVTASGVSYFSSAANSHATVGATPIGSYEAAAHRPGTCAVSGPVSCHDFDPGAGVDTTDRLRVPNGQSVDVTLGWNQPRHGVTGDIDLALFDVATGTVIDRSTSDNVDTQSTFERIVWKNTTGAARDVDLVVASFTTSFTPRFKLVFNRARFTAVEWQTTAGGDVVGPTAYGHNMMVDGASVAASQHGTSTVESFSSRGPATYCWGPVVGTTPAAAQPCATKTVDLTATDGATTTVPGFTSFFGTSAAAPHAAAVAALLRQRAPCRSPDQVLAALRSSARPLSGFGVDAQGAGLVDAVEAVGGLGPCVPSTPAPPVVTGAAATSVTLSWTAPASDPAVTGYQLETFQNGTSAGVSVLGPATTSSRVATPGNRYSYRVRGTTGFGAGPWSAMSAEALPPFRTVDAFTTQQLQDFAGRAPTADELGAWRVALTGGATAAQRVDLATQLPTWAPSVEPVTRLYYAFFDRAPDTGGLTYWVGQLKAGTSLNTAANRFTGTPEFRSRYGTSITSSQFVTLVYQNVLGRSPDAAGLAYWKGELDSGRRNRGRVMTGFSEAPEYRARRAGEVNTVTVFYGMLRRTPTTGEVATWRAQVTSTRLPVITGILGTAAYDARA